MADFDIDEFLRHQLYLHRVEQGLINSIVTPSLEAMYKAIRAILLDKDVPNTARRLEALEKAITKAILDNSPWSQFTGELDNVSIYEASWYQQAVGELVGAAAISDKALLAYVNEKMITTQSGKQVNTGLWPDFVRGNQNAQIEQISGIIKTAYSREWTVKETTAQLRTTFEGVIRNEAEALARTGFAHYTNAAREAWVASSGVRLKAHAVFTFDNRISPTCQFLSTQKTVWDADDPKKPSFPAHFRCRSLYVYLPDGADIKGTRSSVGGQSGEEAKEAFENRESRTDKKVKYRGRRDTNIFKPGQVRASTGYESWLRSQPAWFIDDTLGAGRGKLFREGAELSSFYDMAGRPLTLEELRGRQ